MGMPNPQQRVSKQPSLAMQITHKQPVRPESSSNLVKIEMDISQQMTSSNKSTTQLTSSKIGPMVLQWAFSCSIMCRAIKSVLTMHYLLEK
jgi:hypothetical protein